jgi:hypothetical protein
MTESVVTALEVQHRPIELLVRSFSVHYRFLGGQNCPQGALLAPRITFDTEKRVARPRVSILLLMLPRNVGAQPTGRTESPGEQPPELRSSSCRRTDAPTPNRCY